MRIVNIKHKVVTRDEEQLLEMAGSDVKKFKYEYIPIVAYNTKSKDKTDLTAPEILCFKNKDGDSVFPFTLYEMGTPITLLKSYTLGNISADDLRSVKKAFEKLKGVVFQCSERVVADLCCDIILKEIKNPQKDELVFFIDSFNSDKMFGRLATLNLNLNKITIVFLTSTPSDLMTTVMSYHTGKITFDIYRLMHEEFGDGFIGPYPGDSEESLVQTYFFKPKPIAKGQYRPMRLDIFAQGLLTDEIYEKKELLRNLLVDEEDKPRDKNTLADPSTKKGPRSLIPYGFRELDDKLNWEKKRIDSEKFGGKI
jgi:hypothetical protein